MSIKVFAKQNNLYYENIAAYLNEVNQLGYTAEELDAPKHVIASAHSVVDQGQSITNTLGHLNELVAAYRGRDGFAEHNKDHRNNIVGMTLGTWLEATLGRKPTLAEITVAVGVLAEERMIASFKPKDDPSMVSALTSGALASFWGGTIRSSTIQQLNSRQDKILKRVGTMSDDGRMTRLQLFVESGAARKLKLTDKKNKKTLMELVHGGSGSDAMTASDVLQRPAAGPVDPPGPNSENRVRGDPRAFSPAGQSDLDGFPPDKGDLVVPRSVGRPDPVDLGPDHSNLLDMVPDGQADPMASLGGIDDFDMYQMAEEVFSSLTPDDWAIIPDDHDPFAKLYPIHDGVLPTMESGKLSLTP